MTAQLNRRRLLELSLLAGGGLRLGLAWPAAAAGDAVLNAFVTLQPDGAVEITVPRSELGQGILTALATVLAEELDVPWSRVRVRQAGADAARYGNQATGGSASIRTRWLDLRRAGAAGRELFRAAAAARWQLPVDQCRTRDGMVSDGAGRRLAYTELFADVAGLAPPDDPPLKPVRAFRLIGRSRAALELPELLAGRGGFGLDVRLPGQLFAAVARCPVFGGTARDYDATAALAVPGVREVVTLPAVAGNAGVAGGVAVVADHNWAALRGRDALTVDWELPADAGEDNADHAARLDALLAAPPEDVVFSTGDAPAALAAAADAVIQSDYRLPWLAHATLEPMNCTAQWQGDRVLIHAPTQTPNLAAELVAGALGIGRDRVRLEVTRSGGGFGRRLNADYAVEAALLARALDGPPVQLLWSRDDDLQHDFYRPVSAHRLRALLGADGAPAAWDHQLATPAIFAAFQMPPLSERPGVYEATGAADLPYRVARRRCGHSLLASRVPRGWWRAVSTTHTVFAVESFIDELAHAAGRDPLEYRLALISELPAGVPRQDPALPFEPERLRAVLTLAADRAGWGRATAAGRGLGIACCWDHFSYCAQVVEASMPDAQTVRVHRVVSAVDCGLVINPDGVRAQVEGCVIQGLSAALRERVRLAGGRVAQQNFHDYPILRQHEAPESIEVLIRASASAPSGAGEPALPAVAPALANALFAATGRRYRELPLDRDGLAAAAG